MTGLRGQRIGRTLRRLYTELDERHLAAVKLRNDLEDKRLWFAMERKWDDMGDGWAAGTNRRIAIIDAGEALCGSPFASSKALSDYSESLLDEEVEYLEQFVGAVKTDA